MSRLRQTAWRLATLAMFTLGVTVPARANFIVFESRDAFRAALVNTPATTEGWDEFAPGTIIPKGALVNGVLYQLGGPAANFIVTAGGATVSSPNGLGRTNNPFGGEAFIPGDIITFAFPRLISAFGVSFNTFALSQDAYTLTTNLGDIAPSAYDPFPGLASGQFVGFISGSPVSSVTISTSVPFQFGLDDMIRVTSIPEPTSPMLFVLGLLGLMSSRLILNWGGRRIDSKREKSTLGTSHFHTA